MGRELRMVPKDWQHPLDEKGHYIPLFGGSFSYDLAKWETRKEMWGRGKRESFALNGPRWVDIDEGDKDLTYEEWYGPQPKEDDYMPDWPEEERTHYMMYEDTSEGTPISPAFEAPEELARWLADTGASAFADMTATYEQWLNTIGNGHAVSAVCSPQTGLISGVEAMGRPKSET